MFRIYHCPKCKNTGYVHVENEEAASRCSLCNGPILHEKAMLYAATIDEAKELMADLIVSTQLKSKETGSTRGLGLKKRVYNIIEALIEMNRGRPTSIDEVLRECSEAGIDIERANHFVHQLKDEGLVAEVSGGLTIDDGGIF
jgi:tRNA G26 N,N-dimethylase Trm1